MTSRSRKYFKRKRLIKWVLESIVDDNCFYDGLTGRFICTRKDGTGYTYGWNVESKTLYYREF